MHLNFNCANHKLRLFKPLLALLTFVFAGAVFAVEGDLANLSSTIYTNFANLSKLITAGSYVAGLGFSIASIMKFKAHKDNPTQVQVGTPIALVMIAAALLFLPSILKTTGLTLFSTTGGTVASSTGVSWAP